MGASARAAAQSAVRAGFAPYAGDLFGDVDLQACCPSVRISRYPQELAVVLSAAPNGAWIYTGAVENHPRLIGRLACLRPLLGNGPQVIGNVRDPHKVWHALSVRGISCPAVADNPDGLPRNGSWLVKARHSAGGAQVQPWNQRATLSQRRGRYYFQERVNGLDCAAIFVAARQTAVLLAVSEQLIGDPWRQRPGFRYAGSIGPLPLSATLQENFETLGRALADAFGLTGLFGVDVVVNDEVPWPVEINPRYTASIEVLERGLGLNSVRWHVAACRECTLPAKPTTKVGALHGKAVLYARRNVTMTLELAELIDEANRGAAWPAFADIPPVGSLTTMGRPVLTLFATANDLDTVRRCLESRIAHTERLLDT